MEIQTGALVIVLAYMVGMMIIGYVVGKINIKGSADYLVACLLYTSPSPRD